MAAVFKIQYFLQVFQAAKKNNLENITYSVELTLNHSTLFAAAKANGFTATVCFAHGNGNWIMSQNTSHCTQMNL